jgi:hypothetical protein
VSTCTIALPTHYVRGFSYKHRIFRTTPKGWVSRRRRSRTYLVFVGYTYRMNRPGRGDRPVTGRRPREGSMNPRSLTLIIVLALGATSCSDRTANPLGPSATSGAPAADVAAAGATTGATVSTQEGWGPATPPFNLEAILRPVGNGSGFGLVKFRQPKDDALVVHLDVRVRDLNPNTSYSLQRAVDPPDGQCTSTAWLTLGQGLQPQPVVTDSSGSGSASLFRDLGAVGVGPHFDIYFRVVETATGTPVLQSGCYDFIVSQ